MRAWVLGSGTGIPSPSRGAAGYLVEAGAARILLDCGMGTLNRLVRLGIDYLSIDYVFLSHHHPDHCADVVALLFANGLESERRAGRPLHIVGPEGTCTVVERLYDAFAGFKPDSIDLRVTEQMNGTVEAAGMHVTVGKVQHGSVPAVGYRVLADDRTLVYSGDTTECDGLVALARDCDVLISECSYPEGRLTRSHLTTTGVGRMASQAKAKRVVLSHMYPVCDGVDVCAQTARTFAGPVERAEDLAEIGNI